MKTTGRRRHQLRRAALPLSVPLGTAALFGLHAALAARGHPMPPPSLGAGGGRIARPREVAVLGRAAVGVVHRRRVFHRVARGETRRRNLMESRGGARRTGDRGI
ncbi:hypothetical protein [Streptomyces sp. VRA16 Mangrove soil]|uniref:hypothetical protein n=1 Tax=Streptomyces sp. VRA16 Mangrove soil TaxID=2817434 RepID=UPI001A9FF337|nr:hypothetical protein [Streptomyces sp. VRA16 Mangrove soil]MBO1336521.1 hypothetical protein [Streptomyces sp. VRA16 Mangrove soil]